MKLRTSILTSAILFASFALYAQPQIKGASCTIPGTEYDYFIIGNPDAIAEISICIKGGEFTDTKSTCKTIKPHSSVRINWDDKATNASLTIDYPGGKNSLTINVTSALDPGEIASSLKKQKLKYDTASAVIACSPATGGSCFPTYTYQWQQSANALSWTDIAGANAQDLPSQAALKEPVFYRRRVAEAVSGTTGYSSVATVFVDADYKNR
jgi:hypothetical protein